MNFDPEDGFVGGSEAYLKASNVDSNDQFGYALALSTDGNTLAIAAPGEASIARGIDGDQTNNDAVSSGAVYVFTRAGAAARWVQQAYVKASNAHAGDVFGVGVTLSADGDTMAVGAFLEPSGATGVDGDQGDMTAAYSGAVYVFARVGSAWTQQAYVKASNTGSVDKFGDSVALSGDGNTLAVAAYTEDSAATGIDGPQGDDSANDSGAVYVYARSGPTWAQQAYVKASNTEAGDSFGGVALSGNGDTLAVIASGEDSAATGIDGTQLDNGAADSGAAYVFVRTAAQWAQQAYVKASNAGAGDHLGATRMVPARRRLVRGRRMCFGARGRSGRRKRS